MKILNISTVETSLYSWAEIPEYLKSGSLCRAGDALLFVNCQSQSARENVTLKKSMDDGRNWEALAISASGGYSDVCYNAVTGKAYVLYEAENYKYIRCAEVAIN